MYKGHSIWDEEQDKDDNAGAGEITGEYHKAGDYQNKDSSNEDYIKREAEDNREKEKSEFEKKVDDNLSEKKYENKEEAEDAAVRKKAAEEIKREIDEEKTKINKNSRTSRTIEEAIQKAIKEEKELIRL